MARELGARQPVGAARRPLLVLFNPVTWFDSVVWGQVDSVGVVFLLLGLRELWRDQPERAAIFATRRGGHQAAARHPDPARRDHRRSGARFWPDGGYGDDRAADPMSRGAPRPLAWERGPAVRSGS